MARFYNKLGWSFASPYFFMAILYFLIPLIWAFYLSFSNWNLISPHHDLVGVANYLALLKDRRVIASLFNAYRYMLIIIPMFLFFSLLIALTVYSLPTRYKPFFSVAFFLPYLASGVAVAVIVNGVVSYSSPFMVFLRSRGVSIDLLRSEKTAIFVLSAMIVWKMVGYYALLLLSGLENIPKTVYEAGAIDGVTGVRRLFKITLPLLFPALLTVIILSAGLSFGIFTEPFQLTGGGPNMSTYTWQLAIYHHAFSRNQAGYGAAVAIANGIVTFSSIWIIKRLLEKWGASYGW